MAIQGARGQIPHPILRVEGADVSAWGAGDGKVDAWVCTCWEAAESKWGAGRPGVGVAHVDFEMPITQPRDSWKRGET